MEHSAPRRFSGQAVLLARCAAAILFVALGMSMGPSGAMATPYLVIVIETPEHHLGNNDGNEGTAFEKTFVVGRPLPHPEVVFDITQAFYEAPPRVSLNGAYLGSLSPFFPPFSDPLWRTWDDGTHDYMGTFVVRLPASPALRVGENTFRIENGRYDDDYYFKDVRLEDRYVILGITVGGTVSDGHGHDLEDVRLTLYHDAETTPLATAVTGADGSYQLGVDDLTYGEKYRVTAELESEDHKLVMKEKGTVVSFSRDFTYDTEETEVQLDIDCSKVADLSAASLAKGDVENCASVWHYLQRNRRVAQEIGRDLTATLTVNAFSTVEGGAGAWYDPSENAISMGGTSWTTTPTPPAAGRRMMPTPPPGTSARTARPTSSATR